MVGYAVSNSICVYHLHYYLYFIVRGDLYLFGFYVCMLSIGVFADESLLWTGLIQSITCKNILPSIADLNYYPSVRA